MSIKHGKPASAELSATCLAILAEAGIEPWPAFIAEPRAVQWFMPPELIEEVEPEDGVSLQMYGYPVVMEPMLGENTVALLETLSMREVPQSSSKSGGSGGEAR